MDFLLFLYFLTLFPYYYIWHLPPDFVISLQKDGGSAFNEAHDFVGFPIGIMHPVYYRDQWDSLTNIVEKKNTFQLKKNLNRK